MSNLIQSAEENLTFLAVCLLIVVAIFDSKRDRKGTSEEERHAPEQYAHPPGCYRRRIFSYCGGPDVF